MKKILLTLVTIVLLASGVAADTLYLRDGRALRGTLLGFINGRFAFRISNSRITPNVATRDDGDIQFFRPNEIERVEIEGRSLDTVRFESRTVEVQLGPDWVDSGIDVRRNQRVQVSASGMIFAGRSRITPDGLRSTDPNSPLPRAAEGMLIGAIGNDAASPIIELGSNREFVAERDGRLYLTANRGSYADARGSFSVQIKQDRDLTNRDDADSPFGRRNDRPRTRQPVQRILQQATVVVPGTSRGTDSSIDVRTDDQLTFSTVGTVIAGRRIGEVGPEGGRSTGFGSIVGTRPVPSAGPGALIGYIRLSNGQMSQPFFIGSQLTFSVPTDGRLYLAINDDDYSDNSGSFKVTITH